MNHQQRLAMPSSHLEMPDLDLSLLGDKEKIFVLKYITNGYNGATAAKDSGHPSSASVRLLKKESIRSVIAVHMNARCKILGVDANWVLDNAVKLFGRCMQTEKVIDQYGATGEFKFDAANAIKALNIIGKHTSVSAFNPDLVVVATDLAVMDRLVAARKRCSEQNSLVNIPIEESPVEIEELPFEEVEDEPEISFMRPPSYSDAVADITEPDALITDDEKLSRLMEHWRTNPHER